MRRLTAAVAFEVVVLAYLIVEPGAWDETLVTAYVVYNVGLALFYLKRYLVLRRRRFLVGAIVTDGTVVDRIRDTTGNAHSIEVEYSDATGGCHRIRSMHGVSGAPRIGETTRVFYRPESPGDARLEFDWKMGGSVLTGFAVICTGLGTLRMLIEVIYRTI